MAKTLTYSLTCEVKSLTGLLTRVGWQEKTREGKRKTENFGVDWSKLEQIGGNWIGLDIGWIGLDGGLVLVGSCVWFFLVLFGSAYSENMK